MFSSRIRTCTALTICLVIGASVRAQDPGASVTAQDPEPLFTTQDPNVLVTVQDPGAALLPVAAPPGDREFSALQQRMRELELMFQAQESATTQIIRRSFLERGTQINDFVTFGGTFEVLTGISEDFDGVSASNIELGAAQFDFEVTVNHWTRASLIFEYLDGTNLLFPTTDDVAAGTAIDRINVDTAFLVIGDLQQCPLFVTAGRMIAPFGISTGDPVADVLNIESPLTVEVFEMKQDAILIGYDLIDPRPPTETVLMTPRPAEPLLFAPFFRRLGARANRLVCYPDMWSPARPPGQVPIPVCTLYRYNAGILFFNGKTQTGPEDHIQHMGATAGYQAKGYGWSFDFDVDFTTSVFDSRFLAFEYRSYLDQISYIAGMAAHVKATRGPVSVIAEWNGALQDARFIDDLGNAISISPDAWQVALAYQFDWNPTISEIGSQGTYVTFCYSQSQDLAGVTRVIRRVEPGALPGDPGITTVEESRVGFVPRERFLVSVGEWVTDGLRVAIEYSHIVDYSEAEGGTGATAHGWFGQLTYTW